MLASVSVGVRKHDYENDLIIGVAAESRPGPNKKCEIMGL